MSTLCNRVLDEKDFDTKCRANAKKRLSFRAIEKKTNAPLVVATGDSSMREE